MSKRETIRIIPLGGFGEIGKNMMLIEYQEGILIVDAGLMFPEELTSGIDFLIPDFSYVIENKKKVNAIILTHGHEDHIGALPFLLKEINVPVYGTRLTLGFARNRLDENNFPVKPTFIEIKPRERLDLIGINIEFFRVCHSIADGVGIAFHTPFGTIVHSGDFKIDSSPVYDDSFDFYKIAEFGEKGVLLLMSDSTNAEYEGYTPSESELSNSLMNAIESSKGKVLVATFASSTHRIQQIFDICILVKKKVILLGKSMEKNILMAKDLGYLHYPEGLIISHEKAKNYPKNMVVYLTTGTQGEPMSALSRIANSKHRFINIDRGDTIILSSSIIPGNEKTVSNVVNTLFKRGASVFYEGIEDLHVSGHASKEELKLLMAITKPEYFIPIHGELRHLIQHSNIAKMMGVKEKNIIIAEDGDVIEIDEHGVAIIDRVKSGHVYIEGRGFEDINNNILEDRQRLSKEGIVVVILPITTEDNGILQPEIFSKGFIEGKEAEDLFNRAKDVAFKTVLRFARGKSLDWQGLKTDIKYELKNFFLREKARAPLIVPIIIEV